jgi:N-acyl homoserine lactone hydrolase
MGEVKLYVLNGGMLDGDRALVHPGDDSHRRVLLPIPQYLIQTEGQNILIDTGNPIVIAGDPDGLRREYGVDPSFIKPMVAAENRIDRQLGLIGLQLSDLDMVICTHFHFDHAGGNALFAGVVPITAQEAELIAVRETEGYMPVWDAPGLEFRSVSGDWSPAPSVEMFLTPGHTPGHQSFLVRLQEQPWLFTVDTVYTEEHWREGKLGAVSDVPAARASIERVKEIAERENARLIFGHDIAQWDTLHKAPEYYT